MVERIAIKRNSKIALKRNEKDTSQAVFKILKVEGNGGSSICYTAVCDGKKGRLKEFYPIDFSMYQEDLYFHFERTKENQLYPVGEKMIEEFKRLKAGFIGAYNDLEEAKKSDKKNEVLNNYIPPFEIYYGIQGEESEEASVYIWTPDDKRGESFEVYLEKTRKNPEKDCAEKLYNIINSVIALTDCVCAIHKSGLLHLDLKPSNFLVLYDSKQQVDSGRISLFDINTLYSRKSQIPRTSGSVGFRAPELDFNRVDNRTDIYSLGCILYNGLMVFEKNKSEYYKDCSYQSIEREIENSLLFHNLEIDAVPRFRAKIVETLKKCLNKNKNNRFPCCEELKERLLEIRSLLLPETSKKYLGKKQSLVWVDLEEKGETNPTVVIQNLLYDNPLYDWIPDGEKDINVLVLGCGLYAQKFIDVCLQTGLIIDKHLNITVISEEIEADAESYLTFRPELEKFVDVTINGKRRQEIREDMYASLQFKGLKEKLFLEEEVLNKSALQGVIERKTGTPYQYVFVALGNDAVNQKAASSLDEISRELKLRISVNFVWYGKKKIFRGIRPVYVKVRIDEAQINPELERMAFNVYLIWERRMQRDIHLLYQNFKQKYNYCSSIASALSVKYKLFGLNLKMKDAAQEFTHMFQRKEHNENYKKLVALEHRRWVLNKVVEGWKAPATDDSKKRIKYADCISRGSVKDVKNKIHPCIVRSTEDMPLKDDKYQENNHQLWDEPIDNSLDELDKMSLELHQCFSKYTDKLKSQNPLMSGDVELIQDLIERNKKMDLMFHKYIFCLKSILNEDVAYALRYDYYENQFLESVKESPHLEEIKERVKQIRKRFFPAIEKCKYCDYKSIDEKIVERIPFILTYHAKSNIAMAYEDGAKHNGKSEEIFKNIASALLLLPQKITYMYYVNDDTDIKVFQESLNSLHNFCTNCNLHMGIGFLAAYSIGISEEKIRGMNDVLNQMKKEGVLREFQFFSVEDEKDAIEQWKQKLTNRIRKVDYIDGSTLPFSSHVENSHYTVSMIEGNSYYEFDWEKKLFKNCICSEHLNYIEKNGYIRIEDMFALSKAVDNKFNLPEFADDYKYFWGLYTGKYLSGSDAYKKGVINWTSLCGQLSNYAEKNDTLFRIVFSPENRIKEQKLIYYVPGYCYKSVRFLLKRMKKEKMVLGKSIVRNYTSDTCIVELYTQWNTEKQMDILFSDASILFDKDGLDIQIGYWGNIKHITITYNWLRVDHLTLENSYSHQILKELSKNHYITKLSIEEGEKIKVSFCFSSARIKRLLTQVGEILEIYTYYECRKTGFFDDIVSGYEFKWEKGDVMNEVDCILMKGFQSIFVECKSRKSLEQDFYHKLLSITEQFGIGAKKVLIANTYEHTQFFDRNNDMQKTRGSMMDIITVSDPKEIENIGETLKKIMSGQY